MSNYWPKRPSSKGFSIETLAKNYREKIAKISLEKPESNIMESNEMDLSNHTQKPPTMADKNSHWANRQFYEYFDAA